MKKTFVAPLLAGAMLLMGAATAMSASITYTGSTAMLPLDWGTASPGTIVISLPQWDPSAYPSYYSLTSVDIEWIGSELGNFSGQNMNRQTTKTIAADIHAHINLDVPGLGTSPLSAQPTLTTPTQTMGAYTGIPFNFAAPDGFSLTNLSSFEEVYGSPTNLLPYIGAGNVTFNAWATDESMYLGNSANMILIIENYAAGELEVTYNYTAVPEPSTFVLLGAGLLGAVAMRRRAKK